MKRLPEKGVLDRQCGPFAAKWWLRTLARSSAVGAGGWEWYGLSDYSVGGCCVVSLSLGNPVKKEESDTARMDSGFLNR